MLEPQGSVAEFITVLDRFMSDTLISSGALDKRELMKRMRECGENYLGEYHLNKSEYKFNKKSNGRIHYVY